MIIWVSVPRFGRRSRKCSCCAVIPKRFLFVSNVMLRRSDSSRVLKTLNRQVRSLSCAIRIREESLPHAILRYDIVFESLTTQVEYLPPLTARRAGHDPKAHQSQERERYEHPLILIYF